jgi:hypothetical protein
MNASASAGSHSHGYCPANPASRRTSAARGPIVDSSRRNRLRCCRAHPASIPSNTASCGFSGTTPSASSSRAQPGNPAVPTPNPPVASAATLMHAE